MRKVNEILCDDAREMDKINIILYYLILYYIVY